MTPWNNPTCPRMTWVSLAGVCCGVAAACNFAVFSLLRSQVLQGQEFYTELPESGASLFVPPWQTPPGGWTVSGARVENTTQPCPCAERLVWSQFKTFRRMISYLARKKITAKILKCWHVVKERVGSRIVPWWRKMRNGLEASERRGKQGESERRLNLHSVCRSSWPAWEREVEMGAGCEGVANTEIEVA